ncbi:MAG: hypothetical protein A2X37_09610 [Elusimicrobia bacterium GWA2_66_18]|nr:MAG: hypothetical protein A2X37_09610 [Elusimicrobia bacterium GWA2_66_18]
MVRATIRNAFLLLLAAGPAAAARPELERELSVLMDLFYDIDFDAARAGADALAARHPGHPAGPFYRGVSTYQRWVAEGMRSTDTYRAFEADLDAAELAARSLVADDPAEGHYYWGAAAGFRARALAGQRRFFKAVPEAAISVKHLKKAISLDPTLDDARLGIGMFHYFASRMPAGARPFALLLFGETGDRKLGLEEIRRVARGAGAARMEARTVLSIILAKDDEADWSGSDLLLAELMGRYPRNPLYRLRRVFVAQRRGDLEAAVGFADPEGTWLAKLHPTVRVPARAWALYRVAECRLLQGRRNEAARRLEALEVLADPKDLRDWILLRRANLADAAGRRDEARRLYHRVKDRAPAALARRYLEVPFPAGPQDVAPYFSGY